MAKNKLEKEEKALQTIRDLDLGGGVELTTGVGDRMDYYYTNKLETPEGLPKDLRVEMSSTERENRELLHILLQETKKTA